MPSLPVLGRRDPSQITDAMRRAKDIVAPSPNTFHPVGMGFTSAITVIIVRPLTTPYYTANCLMTMASGSKVPIGRLCIGVDERIGRVDDHEGFECSPIRPFPA